MIQFREYKQGMEDKPIYAQCYHPFFLFVSRIQQWHTEVIIEDMVYDKKKLMLFRKFNS